MCSILFEPVEGQDCEVLEVDHAVAVYVAGDDGFAEGGVEPGFAGLGGAAVGAHVDRAGVGEGFGADGGERIACVDAGAGYVVLDPAFAGGIPASGLGFQMIVAVDPEIIGGVLGGVIGVPVAGADEAQNSPIQPYCRERDLCVKESPQN